ncbi:MAG: DMT family transporter, partial [Promethearchaeota archaeon]
IPLFWLISFRMVFALIGFLPFIGKLGKFNKPTIILSLLLSSVFFIGMVVQTIGLQFIDAGKAGFISGMFVILTPLFSWIFYRSKLKKLLIIPILLSVIGLFIMFFNPEINFLSMGKGELLQFIGAISIAFHILFIGKYIKDINVFTLTFCQLIFMLIINLILAFTFESSFIVSLPNLTIAQWLLLAYLGIFVTTITFIFQIWAQKSIDETSAAIIISLEPVFATFFGFIFGNEQITWQMLVGGSILLVGFIFTILIKKKSRNDKKILKIQANK